MYKVSTPGMTQSMKNRCDFAAALSREATLGTWMRDLARSAELRRTFGDLPGPTPVAADDAIAAA